MNRMTTRSTRSRSRQQSEETNVGQSACETTDSRVATSAIVTALPNTLSPRLTGMTTEELQLLELKQNKLRDTSDLAVDAIRNSNTLRAPKTDIASELLAQVIAASLVFAQEEAGTAVCISGDGLILTCSHCVAESRAEYERRDDKWLVFASGQAVRAKCVAWDPKRDLALLRIVAAQASSLTSFSTSYVAPFSSVSIALVTPKQNKCLFCIGHPGSEDLEASTAGIATDYDVLNISSGRFRGLAAGQDPQNNEEIGALLHDCWTYWGHSGAPLIERPDGELVGLHSSWDDQTGMRRGVPLVAIRAFLSENAGYVLE